MELGIDVGSEMHYVRAFDYREIECKKSFSSTETRFVAFKERIWDSKEKDKVVLGMKPTGHHGFNLG